MSPLTIFRASAYRKLFQMWRHTRSIRKLERMDFASGLGNGAWMLYGLARAHRPEVCVEIGSARGKSACYVGLALRENGRGKLYAIDPHQKTDWNDAGGIDSLPIFQRHVAAAGVSEQVEVIRSTSADAAAKWDKPIDFIFIDGDHTYEGVKRDWELFKPFIKPFGLVLFHDTIWDLQADSKYAREDMGVPRFVEELRAQGYPVITSPENFGISIVQPTIGGTPLAQRDARP